MEKQFIPQLAFHLNEKGFAIRREQDGALTVLVPKGRGRKHELCVVGQEGEVYCSSGDLENPIRKEQIESVMKAVEDTHSAMEVSDTPELGAMGGMSL